MDDTFGLLNGDQITSDCAISCALLTMSWLDVERRPRIPWKAKRKGERIVLLGVAALSGQRPAAAVVPF
jgi:hypothetical protein